MKMAGKIHVDQRRPFSTISVNDDIWRKRLNAEKLKMNHPFIRVFYLKWEGGIPSKRSLCFCLPTYGFHSLKFHFLFPPQKYVKNPSPTVSERQLLAEEGGGCIRLLPPRWTRKIRSISSQEAVPYFEPPNNMEVFWPGNADEAACDNFLFESRTVQKMLAFRPT